MTFTPTEITTFFHFLDNNPSQFFTCAYLDAESKEQIKGYGVKFGKVDSVVKVLDSLAAHNPTLHTTLNQTNHLGRRKENITATRVLCVDLDNGKTLEEIKAVKLEYQPHMIVRSSSHTHEDDLVIAKYHLYWKVEGLLLESWSVFQLGLAHYFGGDETLDGVAKTIRVPGVERVCKDGSIQMPEIVFLDGAAVPLKIEDLVQKFPWYDVQYKEALAAKEEAREVLRAEYKKLKSETGKDGKGGARVSLNVGKVGRNTALWHEVYEAIVKEEIGGSELEVEIHAKSVNECFSAECGGPLSEREVENIVDSAMRTATGKMEEKRVEKEKRVSSNKALLSKINEIAKTPTNGFAGIYEYNYEKGPLKENRFTTLATVARVMQRYGKYLCRIGGALYAFDMDQRIWRPQTKSLDVVNDFIGTCTRDIFRDDEFQLYFSADKLKAAFEKFSSHNFLSGVQQQLVVNIGVARRESFDFDSNPELFFCSNGVLNLVSGELREAEAGDYLLHRSEVRYEAGARCDGWVNFLNEVFAENEEPEEMVSFIQDLFGYSLTGGIEAQKVFVHFGGGSNGKSKVLQALDMLLGGYSALMTGKGFTKGQKGFSVELERLGARIGGKRVVVVDDLDSKAQWSEGVVKNLTGPKMVSRKLYEEEGNIPNRAKFHIGCNERPIPESQNYGLLRRLCIIPYPRQFEPNAAKELELQEMLVAELSGILNWSLEGRNRLRLNGGFREPVEVKEMALEYQREHFTDEGYVNTLLGKPPASEIGNEEHWHTIEEILEHVNSSMAQANMATSFSVTTLGTFLKTKFNLESKREQVGGVRIRKRFVMLLNASRGAIDLLV